MKRLWHKLINRETVLYILFGVLTTVVNYAIYWGLNAWGVPYLISNVVGWVFAVTFAYVTNKQYVFQSKDWSFKPVMREVAKFAGSRLFTLGVEEGGLWLFVSVFSVHENIAKLILAVMVVILNYFLSKLLVFIRKEGKKDGTASS